MKHHFHFLFAAALLLGSLILFNNQKSECLSQLNENPQIEHMELLAEIPSRNATESRVQSDRYIWEIVYKFISRQFRHPESLDYKEHQVCMKRQMQIHLELKPLIAKLSGPYLLHRPSYDDPPVS